jgi:hypothetical protein
MSRFSGLQPGSPAARIPLGRQKQHLEAVIRAGRDTPDHWRALARIQLEGGEAAAAAASLSAAGPAATAEALLLAGQVSLQTGDHLAAAADFRQALALVPQAVAARRGLARCLVMADQGGAALALLAEGLRLDPEAGELWEGLMDTAIGLKGGSELAGLLEVLPVPLRSFACRHDAALWLKAQAKDRSALEAGLLAEELVAEHQLLPPDDPLLTAVLEEVRAAADFVETPFGKTTRGGAQAPFPLSPSRPAWRDLWQRIVPLAEAQADRIAGHCPGWDQVGPLGVRGWAVRLRPGGRQAAHLHPTGWLTGVLYVSAGDGPVTAESGSLHLPLPPPGYVQDDWPDRRILPLPGRLVIFPSYLRHCTGPFRGTGERVSLAFDIHAL